MKKLRPLCLIFVTLIILFSLSGCVHTIYVQPQPPILPSWPNTVTLTDDSEANEYRLIIQDLRWRLWAAFTEWQTGIITEEEYNKKIEPINKKIDEINSIINNGDLQ